MTATYFLVRYDDFTLDTIHPNLNLVDEMQDVRGVESIIPMGAYATLILDRDYLVRTHR